MLTWIKWMLMKFFRENNLGEIAVEKEMLSLSHNEVH